MQTTPTKLADVLLIEPKVFGDERGYFFESWNARRYCEIGLPAVFCQDNLSRSEQGVLRGLHFQNPNQQGKLVYVLDGEVYDVAVDIRRGSPTFGEWIGVYLSAQNKKQLYIPPGFAHGFCVTSPSALFAYKCTAPYDPAAEYSIRWDDPSIGISWRTGAPVLSNKDQQGLLLSELPSDALPAYDQTKLCATLAREAEYDGLPWRLKSVGFSAPTALQGHRTASNRIPEEQRSDAAIKISQPTRILLVGSTGQVGSELHRSLQNLGDVVSTTRQENGHSLQLDLTNEENIRAVVRRVQPNLIINAAAYTAVDKAEKEPELAMAINGTAPGILAQEANRLAAAVVHYSTDYVFDGTGSRACGEEDATNPLNEYGRTKLAGEKAIRAENVPHLILRISWVYGAEGGANFVRTMLRLGAERSVLDVVSDQFGAPTSARFIANATAEILAQGLSGPCDFLRGLGGIVHLACKGETSRHGFAQKIFGLARQHAVSLQVQDVRSITTDDFPTPAVRPRNSRLCCDRLDEKFSVNRPFWEDTLEEAFAGLCMGKQKCDSHFDAAHPKAEGNLHPTMSLAQRSVPATSSETA